MRNIAIRKHIPTTRTQALQVRYLSLIVRLHIMIAMLFQLVVVCAVQNSHYMLLSAVISRKLLLWLYLISSCTVLLVSLLGDNEGHVHARRAHKNCLMIHICKFLFYSHLFTLRNLCSRLHILY